MSRIIQPIVSPRGRVILLSGATLWLIAAIVLSAMPDGARASTTRHKGILVSDDVIEHIAGTDSPLYFPRAVADGNDLLIADRGNHQVLRVGSDMVAKTIYGREGAGPGELMSPMDVAVDSRGNVFVVDSQLERISKYAADGTFLASATAPTVSTVLIDRDDNLIIYPAPGKALLQRFSNDLEPGEGLLEETDEWLHRTSIGVLIAFDQQDRLFVLDQVALTLSIYDADMKLQNSWDVDAPELRSSMEARLQYMQSRNPKGRAHVMGFQAMTLSGDGLIALHYFVKRGPEASHFSRVAWFSHDGDLIATEDRENRVFASALTADGRRFEGTAEALVRFQPGSRETPTSRGDN